MSIKKEENFICLKGSEKLIKSNKKKEKSCKKCPWNHPKIVEEYVWFIAEIRL